MVSALALPPVRPLVRATRLPPLRPAGGLSNDRYNLDFAAMWRSGYSPAQVTSALAAAGFTFARASTALDPIDGTSFSTDQPRVTSDGLLVEGSRQNLQGWSNAANGASWSAASASVTANNVTAPDGSSSGDTVTEAGTGALLRDASAITITTATSYTVSAYLRRVNTDWVRVNAGDSTALTNMARIWVNLATGALGTSGTLGTGWSVVAASVKPAANGWFRASLTFQSASATTLYLAFCTASADNSASRADVGSGAGNGGAFAVWGAMLEQASFPSSIYPTTSASAVTRAAESCVRTVDANFMAQGTVIIEFVPPIAVTDNVRHHLLAITDGGLNRWALRMLDSVSYPQFIVGNGSTTTTSSVATNYSGVTVQHVAIAWNSARSMLAHNGALGSAGGGYAHLGSNTTLALGHQPGGGNECYARILSVRHLNYMASDTELAALSVQGPAFDFDFAGAV